MGPVLQLRVERFWDKTRGDLERIYGDRGSGADAEGHATDPNPVQSSRERITSSSEEGEEEEGERMSSP
jgi:hypothetical protein